MRNVVYHLFLKMLANNNLSPTNSASWSNSPINKINNSGNPWKILELEFGIS